METDEYNLNRLREELVRIEQAKKRNDELAARSFENWSKANIEKIGRATGFHIKIAKKKFRKIWEWLIS